MSPPPTPLSIEQCGALACILEATAPKVGNVHRSADFEDLCFADFAISATLLGAALPVAAEVGVGRAVRDAVQNTARMVGSNTNLGIALLLAPLAAVKDLPHRAGIENVLQQLTPQDAADIYEAIQMAQAGGLGEAEEWDVNTSPAPDSIVDAMRLAEDRDLIAKQYVSGFASVFEAAELIEAELNESFSLESSIVLAHLQILATYGDSLIERKCGAELAAQARMRAGKICQLRRTDPESVWPAIGDFDFWLRTDGHQRNPGATADLIAAGLFVLLRESRIAAPFPTSGQLARTSLGQGDHS